MVISLPGRQPGTALDDEHVAVLSNISWDAFLRLDEALGESPRRKKYWNGELEFMSPISSRHETIKKNLACILEAYCQHRGIFFHALGATTLRKEEERSGEPDESYVFERERTTPQIVIEVSLSSGGINKLGFYAGWAIPEIWIWQNNQINIYAFDEKESAYHPQTKSRFLPDLDLFLVEKLATVPYTSDALKMLRDSFPRDDSLAP